MLSQVASIRIKLYTQEIGLLPLILLTVVGVCILGSFFTLSQESNYQQFTLQAEGLLKGQFHMPRLDPQGGNLDSVGIDGKYYWPLGIVPAVILLPFVGIYQALGFTTIFPQGVIQFLLNLAILAVGYALARKYKFNKLDSMALSSAFVFGSIFVSSAWVGHSWYFSHTVAVLVMLLAILEYKHDNRSLFIGMLYAVLVHVRVTTVATLLFFVARIWLDKKTNTNHKFIESAKLAAPIAVSVLILILLNFARFGNPLTTGYEQAIISPTIQATMRDNYGLFSPQNIISNIYLFFFMPPEPVFQENTYHLVAPYFKINPIGLSIFLVAPLFCLAMARWRNWFTDDEHKLMLITNIPAFILVLMYYASGFWTLGPRYLLDIFPFVFAITLFSLKKSKPDLSNKVYVLIIVSIIANTVMLIHLYRNPDFAYWGETRIIKHEALNPGTFI